MSHSHTPYFETPLAAGNAWWYLQPLLRSGCYDLCEILLTNDRKKTYCDHFIAKTWIIHMNLSAAMILVSFKLQSMELCFLSSFTVFEI